MPTAEDYAKLSDSDKKKEDFMNAKWRPMMAWTYLVICVMDFVVFPILWSVIQTIGDGKVESQWMPITLQGAGLLHLSFGAILGIAAYGRTQEKLNGANHGGLPPPSVAAPAPAFGSMPLGNNTMSTVPTTAPAFKPAPAPSPFAAPVQPPHPEI